jgi:hypothetical protein
MKQADTLLASEKNTINVYGKLSIAAAVFAVCGLAHSELPSIKKLPVAKPNKDTCAIEAVRKGNSRACAEVDSKQKLKTSATANNPPRTVPTSALFSAGNVRK